MDKAAINRAAILGISGAFGKSANGTQHTPV
jgi:hypothetical protein